MRDGPQPARAASSFSPRSEEERDPQEAEEDHERAHRHARGEEQEQVGEHEDAVEHGRQRRRGERPAQRAIALEPLEQIARGPLDEEPVGEACEMVHEREAQSRVDLRAQVVEEVAPEQQRHHVEDDEDREAGDQDAEQAPVLSRHHAIHDRADQDRKRQRLHLQHGGEQDRADQDARVREHRREVGSERAPRRAPGLESGAGLEDERHARELLAHVA